MQRLWHFCIKAAGTKKSDDQCSVIGYVKDVLNFWLFGGFFTSPKYVGAQLVLQMIIEKGCWQNTSKLNE